SLNEATSHHDDQDDANAESGARWQGLDQTMHSCRRKVHWVGTRIWGDWVECFHHRPSIPNPSTEIYSNGKTRVIEILCLSYDFSSPLWHPLAVRMTGRSPKRQTPEDAD